MRTLVGYWRLVRQGATFRLVPRQKPVSGVVLGVAAVLLGSYIAKRRLLAQWNKYRRTGRNDLNYRSASELIALSIPWDATAGLILPGYNVLVGRGLMGRGQS